MVANHAAAFVRFIVQIFRNKIKQIESINDEFPSDTCISEP